MKFGHFLQIFTKKVFNFILLLLFSFKKNYALNWLWVIEWSWVILAHIFLLKKFMIVAHFFWEVIVSDLAHEKSELVHLWLWLGMYRCIKSSTSILLVGLKTVFELKCYNFCTYYPPRNFNFFQYIVRGNIPADCWSILHHHIFLFFRLYTLK